MSWSGSDCTMSCCSSGRPGVGTIEAPAPEHAFGIAMSMKATTGPVQLRLGQKNRDPIFTEGVLKCYSYMKASAVFQQDLYTQDARVWRLGDVINSMQWRSTSHPPDALICCAVLAGIEESLITDLLQTSEQQRMLKFVNFYPKIPS